MMRKQNNRHYDTRRHPGRGTPSRVRPPSRVVSDISVQALQEACGQAYESSEQTYKSYGQSYELLKQIMSTPAFKEQLDMIRQSEGAAHIIFHIRQTYTDWNQMIREFPPGHRLGQAVRRMAEMEESGPPYKPWSEVHKTAHELKTLEAELADRR